MSYLVARIESAIRGLDNRYIELLKFPGGGIIIP